MRGENGPTTTWHSRWAAATSACSSNSQTATAGSTQRQHHAHGNCLPARPGPLDRISGGVGNSLGRADPRAVQPPQSSHRHAAGACAARFIPGRARSKAPPATVARPLSSHPDSGQGDQLRARAPMTRRRRRHAPEVRLQQRLTIGRVFATV